MQDIRKILHSRGQALSRISWLHVCWDGGCGEIDMQHYPSVGAGRRSRESERRRHKITVRLSEAELATLIAAAGRAGLALGAYIVRAGVDAAEHRAAPIAEVQREALLELIRAVELAYRVGVNLEQVVARLNATGEPGPDLGLAVADCMQVVHRIDEAAQAIVRCLKLRAGQGTPGGFQRRTPLARPRPSSLLRTPWSRRVGWSSARPRSSSTSAWSGSPTSSARSVLHSCRRRVHRCGCRPGRRHCRGDLAAALRHHPRSAQRLSVRSSGWRLVAASRYDGAEPVTRRSVPAALHPLPGRRHSDERLGTEW